MVTYAAEGKELEIAKDVEYPKEGELTKLVRLANLEEQSRQETCPQN